MNRFLIRLFLVAVLLCDFLGSAKGAKVQDIAVADEQRSEELIKQNDVFVFEGDDARNIAKLF